MILWRRQQQSRDMYQPIASLYFLVTKPEFSDSSVDIQRRVGHAWVGSIHGLGWVGSKNFGLGWVWKKWPMTNSDAAMDEHPLLLEWHGSAAVSRSVWELVEGFLEGISRLLGSGGGRKSVPICHCHWEKWELVGINARWHKCISSTVSTRHDERLSWPGWLTNTGPWL